MAGPELLALTLSHSLICLGMQGPFATAADLLAAYNSGEIKHCSAPYWSECQQHRHLCLVLTRGTPQRVTCIQQCLSRTFSACLACLVMQSGMDALTHRAGGHHSQAVHDCLQTTSRTQTGCGPRQTPGPCQRAYPALPRGLSSMSQQDHVTHLMMGAQVGACTLQGVALHCLAHHHDFDRLGTWQVSKTQALPS